MIEPEGGEDQAEGCVCRHDTLEHQSSARARQTGLRGKPFRQTTPILACKVTRV